NTVFLGTFVTTGYANVLVTKTGKNTQIGRMSANLRKINTGDILLREKVNKIAKYLTIAVLFYLAVVLLEHTVVLYVSRNLLVNGVFNLRLFAGDVSTSLITAMSIMPINIPLLTTIALITGVLAMAAHRVVIRDLNAVESLGRVSVVCSDKTGTITKEEMTVKWISLPSVRGKSTLYGVTGIGYESNGRIVEINSDADLEKLLGKEPGTLGGSEVKIKNGARLELLLVSGLLNNESSIIEQEVETKDGGEKVIAKALGNATDASILVMFRKSKLSESFYRSNFQEIRSYPFDSKMRRMTKVLRFNGKYIVFTKGATETILSLCKFICKDEVNEIEALSKEDTASVNKKADIFSASGFRVISFAYKYLDELPLQSKGEREFLENSMTYLGFVAIIDPPREGVLESISEAKSAGVKTVIVTGDSVETGKSIAREVGIFEEDSLAVEGKDVAGLSDKDFLKAAVFARVSPEHKMDIMDRYKKLNHVVAMTGDGVNDTLAISKADVGIAMGITGTDVAKEAADMVITDDSFSTIVTGIREGRGVFQKIQSIVFFYIAVNLAEALVYFGSSFIPNFHLLDTWQFIFITLTIHSIPPFALIVNRLSKDVMKEKPRDTEDIFTKRLIVALLLFSISLSIVLYVGYFGTLYGIIPVFGGNKIGLVPSFKVINSSASPSGWAQAKARTLLYTILVVAECTLVVSLMRINKSIPRILKEDNYWIIWPFILIVPAVLLALMYIPEIQLILARYVGINLDIIRLTFIDWVIAVLLGLIPIALLEYYKNAIAEKKIIRINKYTS
ncbi:MAG TPA: cation-transporting P-type ATPase, partial [archaeon]|nr:cation-transporting P-type ATPase [archaeon]